MSALIFSLHHLAYPPPPEKGEGKGRRGIHTLAVRPGLFQEEDLCALQRQKVAYVAVDVLLLIGLGLAAWAGVGLDYFVVSVHLLQSFKTPLKGIRKKGERGERTRRNILQLNLRRGRRSHKGESSNGGGEEHFCGLEFESKLIE